MIQDYLKITYIDFLEIVSQYSRLRSQPGGGNKRKLYGIIKIAHGITTTDVEAAVVVHERRYPIRYNEFLESFTKIKSVLYFNSLLAGDKEYIEIIDEVVSDMGLSRQYVRYLIQIHLYTMAVNFKEKGEYLYEEDKLESPMESNISTQEECVPSTEPTCVEKRNDEVDAMIENKCDILKDYQESQAKRSIRSCDVCNLSENWLDRFIKTIKKIFKG